MYINTCYVLAAFIWKYLLYGLLKFIYVGWCLLKRASCYEVQG